MQTFQKRIIYLFLILSLLPLIIFASINIFSSINFLQHIQEQRINNIALVKQANLEGHIKSIANMMLSISKSAVIQRYASSLSKRGRFVKEYNDAYKQLLAFQETYWGLSHHMFLANTKGRVLISPPHKQSRSSHLNHKISGSSFF